MRLFSVDATANWLLKFLAISGVLGLSPATALVNMRNANYSDSWIDIIDGESRIYRTYNSRSLYRGLFGFGWNSELETTIRFFDAGLMVLVWAGSGNAVAFSFENDERDLRRDLQQRVMEEVRRRNPTKGEDFFGGLERDLRLDIELLHEFLRQLGFSASPVEGQQLTSQSGGMAVRRGSFIYVDLQGDQLKFDLRGQLLQLVRGGVRIDLSYADDRAIHVFTDGIPRLYIVRNEQGLVESVQGASGPKAYYYYDEHGLLVTVVNAWGNRYEYEYDDDVNLSRVTFPDGTFIAIAYNEDDWVTSFTDRNGCVERYSYTTEYDSGLRLDVSEVVKDCDGKVTNTSRFEHWIEESAAGTRLIKTRKIINGVVSQADYSRKRHSSFQEGGIHRNVVFDYLGRPATEIREGKEIRYIYATECPALLERIEGPGAVFEMRYNSACGLVMVICSDGTRYAAKRDNLNRVLSFDDGSGTVRFEYKGESRIPGHAIVEEAKIPLKRLPRSDISEVVDKTHFRARSIDRFLWFDALKQDGIMCLECGRGPGDFLSELLN